MLFIILGQAELSSTSFTSTSWVEGMFWKQYVHTRGRVVASYMVSNFLHFFLFQFLKERIKVYEQN